MEIVSRYAWVVLGLTLWMGCGTNPPHGEGTGQPKSEEILHGDTVLSIGASIRDIFQDKKGTYWFASDGEGVFSWDGKTIENWGEKQGLTLPRVWKIDQGEDETLYFSGNGVVASYDGTRFRTLLHGGGPLQTGPLAGSRVFFGQYLDNGMLRDVPIPHTSHLSPPSSSKSYSVYCTYKDKRGNIWFGTESQGVCKYDGYTYTWLDTKELGVPIRAICEDQNGDIWIGNNGYGLFRYDGIRLHFFTREQNLENPGFLQGLEGKAGTLARVFSLTGDREGNLWVGTIDAGLWRYDGKNLVNFTLADGLSSNAIQALYSDAGGTLWIGTGVGVTRYDGKAFSIFAGKK